jgi:hypothetical protein
MQAQARPVDRDAHGSNRSLRRPFAPVAYDARIGCPTLGESTNGRLERRGEHAVNRHASGRLQRFGPISR